jgi:hypothetical protein
MKITASDLYVRLDESAAIRSSAAADKSRNKLFRSRIVRALSAKACDLRRVGRGKAIELVTEMTAA